MDKYCQFIGKAIWDRITLQYNLQDKLIPEDGKPVHRMDSVLNSVVEGLDNIDASKEFKIFIITSLFFEQQGESVLRCTEEEFNEISDAPIKEFAEAMHRRLGHTNELADFVEQTFHPKENLSGEINNEKTGGVGSATDNIPSQPKKDIINTPQMADVDQSEAEKMIPPQNKKLIPSNFVTGRLRIVSQGRGGFYNFFPLYSWEEGMPRLITDAKERFAPRGSFQLSQVLACSQVEKDRLVSGGLYNIAYSDNEIVKSFNTQGEVKYELNVVNLFKEKRIFRADLDETDASYRRAFYKVTPAEGANLSNVTVPFKVKLAGEDQLPEEFDGLVRTFVLLDLGDSCIGPFRLDKDPVGHLQISLKRVGHTNFIYDSYVPNSNVLPAIGRVRKDLECVFIRFSEKAEIDLIDDEKLLDLVVKEMPKDTGTYTKIKEWLDFRKEDGGQIKSQLTQDRVARVLTLMKETDFLERHYGKILDLLLRSVKTNLPQKEELIKSTAEAVAKDKDAAELLRKTPSIKQVLGDLEKTKKKIEGEIKNLEKAKDEKEKKLKADYKQLESDISSKRSELDSLKKTVKEKEAEIQAKRKEFENADNQLKNFEDRLDQTVEKVSSLAFEGSLTSKIMESAARWNKDRADDRYKQRIEALQKVKRNPRKDSQLNDYLCKQLATFRNYHINEFVNILVCTAQSFLTVFAGFPGSGKTSMCNHLARVLGLTSLQYKPELQELWQDHPSYANRYIPISVERGWTSKRDLIGYFNPLNRKFESVDPHRFECFQQLDYEKKAGFFQLPYFLLLDEANLSSMEYYFADFMNICDERNDLSFITLGDNHRFFVPDTLRFLATINNDHTTEKLSPRLVDRTWVIQLPEVEDNDLNKPTTAIFDPIDWQLFKDTYQPQKNIKEQITSDLHEIAEILSSLGSPVSPRTRNAIHNYVSSAQEYMKSDTCGSPYLEALDYAVAQKLLPIINGSGELYQQKLEKIKGILETKSLMKSARRLDTVIRKGNDLMGYYRFF